MNLIPRNEGIHLKGFSLCVRRTPRNFVYSGTILFAIITLLFLAQPATTTAASGLVSHSFPSNSTGYTYGSALTIPVHSTLAASGPTAPVAVSCSTRPETITNSTANVSRGSLLSGGATNDQITTSRSATSASVQVTSTVQSVNVLRGLVVAGSVRAVASSTATAAGATSTGQGSRFTALRVAGVPVALTPAPNTRLALPGVGFVVLNEQSGPLNGARASTITVTMLDIQVMRTNSFGLPVGTHLMIAHAMSGETRVAQPMAMDTYTYSMYVLAAGNASLGPVAPTSLSCTGGSNHNGVGSLNSTSIGRTSVLTSSASGSLTTSGGTTTDSASVAAVNVLGGLIQADSITATAQAALGTTGSGSTSVTFVNAKIAGVSLNAHPTANSSVKLAGIGYAYLNESSGVRTSSRAAQGVIALDVYVTTANSLGLPIGARIIIANAYASITRY